MEWRLLQAAYVIAAGLLVVPAYPLLKADLYLAAALYTVFAILALTKLRQIVLARIER